MLSRGNREGTRDSRGSRQRCDFKRSPPSLSPRAQAERLGSEGASSLASGCLPSAEASPLEHSPGVRSQQPAAAAAGVAAAGGDVLPVRSARW